MKGAWIALTCLLLVGAAKNPCAAAPPPTPMSPTGSPSWRSTEPAPGASRTWAPTVRHGALSNGLPVYVVQNPTMPMITISLVVRGGSGDNPPQSPGLANVLTTLLAQGAGGRSAIELSERSADLGGAIKAETTSDYSAIRVTCLAERLEQALALLADLSTRPTFTEGGLMAVLADVETQVQKDGNKGSAVAERVLRSVVYGARHPYAHGDLGSIDSVRRLSLPDLRAHYEAYWTSSNAAVVVAGDVTFERALPLVDRAFASWRARGVPKHTAKATLAPAVRRIVMVDRPGAALGDVMVGQLMSPLVVADGAALDVMVQVLGGSYSARLNRVLRLDKGYTYSARAKLLLRRHGSMLLLRGGMHLEKTALAIKEIETVVGRMISHPPDQEEFARARSLSLARLADRFATQEQAVSAVAELVASGQPADGYARQVRMLGALTLSDVVKATRALRPNALSIVVAGPASKLEPQFAASGLQPVERWPSPPARTTAPTGPSPR